MKKLVRTGLDHFQVVQILILPEDKHRSKKTHNETLFHLPYINDGTAIVDDMVRRHLLCTRGLQRILAFGKRGMDQSVMLRSSHL
jgi:hypothetical protein